MPSGLISTKPPIAGVRPKNSAFERPLAPRPCGEMTTGSGGFAFGPYHAGSTTCATRGRPAWLVYWIVHMRVVVEEDVTTVPIDARGLGQAGGSGLHGRQGGDQDDGSSGAMLEPAAG